MVDAVDRRSGSGEGKEPEKPSDTEPKKEEEQAQGQVGMLPQPTIAHLAERNFMQALVAMGQAPHPGQEKPRIDLDLAQYFIACIEVLRNKTQGNLTEVEAKQVERYLHQAKLTYVTATKEVDSSAGSDAPKS